MKLRADSDLPHQRQPPEKSIQGTLVVTVNTGSADICRQCRAAATSIRTDEVILSLEVIVYVFGKICVFEDYIGRKIECGLQCTHPADSHNVSTAIDVALFEIVFRSPQTCFQG